MSSKYIIYKGNKYVRVDSASKVAAISFDQAAKAVNSLEKNLAAEVTPKALGLNAKIYGPGADRATAKTIKADWFSGKFVFKINIPLFGEAAPESGKFGSLMDAAKGKVDAIVRRVCQKGGMDVKSVNVKVSPNVRSFGYYIIDLTAILKP